MASDMSFSYTKDKLVPGGWLTSRCSSYQILALLGEGSYGTVAKCVRMADKKIVAIKVIKNENQNDPLEDQELTALRKLKACNSNKYNIVEWYQAFTDSGRLCLEFEYLEKSLFDFMKERYFKPLTLKEIRPIVVQIAFALSHLKSIGMVHGDLKLENIMLVKHPQDAKIKIKVIDFGLACDTSTAIVGSYIQSRPYRSPEIILGLPFTEATDIWSLGCIAVTLYTGFLLYPGYSEYAMLRFITATQGQLPETMLNCGQKTDKFFYRELNSGNSHNWKLKTTEQYFQEFGIPFVDTRILRLQSLDDLLHLRLIKHQDYADTAAEIRDILMFVEMAKHLLHLDPKIRMTPDQLLDHSFLKMNHCNHCSSYVRSCYEQVNTLRRETTPHSGTKVRESPHQATTDTRQSVQRNLRPRAVKRKIIVSPHCPSAQRRRPTFIRPSQSQNAETIPVKAQPKRKRLEEHTEDVCEPKLKRNRTEWKDVHTNTLYQHERSDAEKYHYSLGPRYKVQIFISASKRKPDENNFETSNERVRTNCENDMSDIFTDSRVEDYCCREAKGGHAKLQGGGLAKEA